MFEVRFSTKEEGLSLIGWEPSEGDGFSCRKREALRRWEHLLIEGREGRPVDGAVPHIVEIVDNLGKVMITCTTGVDLETGEPDEPKGPWAAKNLN